MALRTVRRTRLALAWLADISPLHALRRKGARTTAVGTKTVVTATTTAEAKGQPMSEQVKHSTDEVMNELLALMRQYKSGTYTTLAKAIDTIRALREDLDLARIDQQELAALRAENEALRRERDEAVKAAVEQSEHVQREWLSPVEATALRAKLEAAEKTITDREEGYRALDNWNTVHDAAMSAVRETCGMPDATVPELCAYIQGLQAKRN